MGKDTGALRKKTGPKQWPYEDIVNLPHHVSKVHSQMDMIKRAAQFAPFSALTGYEDAVEETARLTDERIELDETALEELNRKMTEAMRNGKEIQITYFVPDERKAGGSYTTIKSRISKIIMGKICMENGMQIPTDRVLRAEQ